MTYHLFNSAMSHLNPNILSGIFDNVEFTNKNGKNDIFIILKVPKKMIFGSKDFEISKYYKLFKKYEFNSYAIIENDFHLLKHIWAIKPGLNKLIIHSNFSLFNVAPFFPLMLIFRGKKFLKSVVKVEWGVKPILETKTIIKRLKFLIEKMAYTNFGSVVNLTEKDAIITKRKFPAANTIVVGYLLSYPNYAEFRYTKAEEGLACKIMISHSGHVHNNHFKSFELLAKFKNEDIQIICPLCYGNQNYIKEVIEKGKKIFGKKFNYFTKLKPLDEYVHLICNQHIYISAANIQTGLFAASTALANGLKLYLGDNLFDHFNKMGFILGEIDNLEEISFNNFELPLTYDEFNHNKSLSSSSDLKNLKIQIWKQLYEI